MPPSVSPRVFPPLPRSLARSPNLVAPAGAMADDAPPATAPAEVGADGQIRAAAAVQTRQDTLHVERIKQFPAVAAGSTVCVRYASYTGLRQISIW